MKEDQIKIVSEKRSVLRFMQSRTSGDEKAKKILFLNSVVSLQNSSFLRTKTRERKLPLTLSLQIINNY